MLAGLQRLAVSRFSQVWAYAGRLLLNTLTNLQCNTTLCSRLLPLHRLNVYYSLTSRINVRHSKLRVLNINCILNQSRHLANNNFLNHRCRQIYSVWWSAPLALVILIWEYHPSSKTKYTPLVLVLVVLEKTRLAQKTRRDARSAWRIRGLRELLGPGTERDNRVE